MTETPEKSARPSSRVCCGDEQLVQRIDNAATEQPFWSSSLGSIRRRRRGGGGCCYGRTPLELKTGKGHVDHEAQAAIYVAMLRGLDSNWARGSQAKLDY